MEQEDREAGQQQHEKDDAASNSSSPHFASPNGSAPAPFPSLPPGTDFFPYAHPMQPLSLFPVPIARPSCYRYSTCWGWPELGAYHTCVGYWSGYYASRPAIKQVRITLPQYASTVSFGSLKQASRAASALLHSAATAGVLAAFARPALNAPDSLSASPSPSALQPLREANALAQHHDAITGTAKLPVLYDYLSQLAEASDAAFQDFARNLGVLTHAPDSENITAVQLNAFTGWVDEPSADGKEHASLRPVIVYNSLLQQRNVLVVIRTSPSPQPPIAPLSSKHSSSPPPTGRFIDALGNPIACEAIPCSAASPICPSPDGFLLHSQIDVPALGFTTVFINGSDSCDILNPENASWIE